MNEPRHDPGLYGRSFADVYDSWYPGGDEAQIVEFLSEELSPGARVLEWGVGTGRVALPLTDAGFTVTGADSSTEMLAHLRRKDPAGSVEPVLADAGDPGSWPETVRRGGFDCVLAGCNLLLNLTAEGAQQACVAGSAALLATGGAFVCEMSPVLLPDTRRVHTTNSSAEVGGRVLVTTDADPGSGIVRGRHHQDGADGPVLRRWEIRALDRPTLRGWCDAAGLTEAGGFANWDRDAPDDAHPVLVSLFRRNG